MVIWDVKAVWRMMVVGLPVLVGTVFETIDRGLSPRGVEVKIPMEFAVVEKWG